MLVFESHINNMCQTLENSHAMIEHILMGHHRKIPRDCVNIERETALQYFVNGQSLDALLACLCRASFHCPCYVRKIKINASYWWTTSVRLPSVWHTTRESLSDKSINTHLCGMMVYIKGTAWSMMTASIRDPLGKVGFRTLKVTLTSRSLWALENNKYNHSDVGAQSGRTVISLRSISSRRNDIVG